MQINYRKVFLITGFFVVVIGLAFAIYYLFFKAPAPVVVINEPTYPGGLPTTPSGGPGGGVVVTPPGGLILAPGIIVPPSIVPSPTGPTISTTANGGIVVPTKLVQAQAQFVNLSPGGNNLNFYDAGTGLFSRVNSAGETELLSTRVFRDIKNVTWANNTDKAVLEFPDGSNIIYNFSTNESFTLPSQYEDFSFSPDSTQVAAKDLKLNKEDRWLVVVDDKGRNKQLIEHLGANESRVQVKWNPNDRIVGTSAKSIDGNRAEIIFLTKDGEELTKAVIQGRDLRYQYSPTGNTMLYSVYNSASNYLPTLWITSSNPNSIDSGRVNLKLNTWADKCAFANESTIYCAVPKSIGQYSGILNSNNESDDNIYKIDTYSGTATLAAEPLVSTQIGTMSVTKDGKTLYYTNKETQSINKIGL